MEAVQEDAAAWDGGQGVAPKSAAVDDCASLPGEVAGKSSHPRISLLLLYVLSVYIVLKRWVLTAQY